MVPVGAEESATFRGLDNLTSKDTLSLAENRPTFFVIGVLTIPTSIVGTLGSITTLYLITRLDHNKSSTNALIINLCIATFLLCGTSSFFDAFTMITGGSGPSNICCVIFAFLHFLWISVSAHSHAAIAAHRLLAVVSHQVTHCAASHCTAAVLVTYTWLVPFLVLIFPLFNTGGTYGFSIVAYRCSIFTVSSPSYAIVLKLMNSFVPLGIMTLCYFVICCVVVRSKLRFNMNEQAIRGQGARGARLLRLKAEFRVSRIAFLTCTWFIICYIPSSVHGLIATQVAEMQSSLSQFFILMTWIGCATTPILYTFLSTEMRDVARSELKRLARIIRGGNSIHSMTESPRGGPLYLLPKSLPRENLSRPLSSPLATLNQ